MGLDVITGDSGGYMQASNIRRYMWLYGILPYAFDEIFKVEITTGPSEILTPNTDGVITAKWGTLANVFLRVKNESLNEAYDVDISLPVLYRPAIMNKRKVVRNASSVSRRFSMEVGNQGNLLRETPWFLNLLFSISFPPKNWTLPAELKFESHGQSKSLWLKSV
jgi:hypothetical protein